MVVSEQRFSPKDGFVVYTPKKLFDSQLEIILKLYQPLIGASGFSLYALLRTMIQPDLQLSNRKMHSELFDLLGIGTQEFYEVRCRLEAIGLLRTFEKEDELGKLVIYEIQEPQGPKAFFSDDLLRSLLLEMVGERIFKELKDYFFYTSIDKEQVVETTKHFWEIFSINVQKIESNGSLDGSKQINSDEPKIKNISKLDKSFLKQIIDKSFVDSKQIFKNYDRLVAANTIYGIDELELFHLIEEAANVATNQVDFNLFWKLVHERFSKQDSNYTLTEVAKKKVVDKQNFKDEDQELLEASRAYAPAEFLQELKREKGSFVTGAERNIIEWAVQKNLFQPEILNILIHYMIVDRGMATLNRAFFETTIADWRQRKISTPEDAMLQVRSFNKPTKKNPTNYKQQVNYSNSRKVIQKEKLPEWAHDEYVAENKTSISKEEQDALKKRLSRFKKKS